LFLPPSFPASPEGTWHCRNPLFSRRKGPRKLSGGQFICRSVSVAMVAALVAVTFSGPADARVKTKKRSTAAQTQAVQTQQVPSLDGRITGRPRTCGFATFQYDGWGVPYGPYCH